MVRSPTSVSLGPYDPFKLVPTLTIQDGKITFVPGKNATELASAQTQFAFGATVEYRIEKGDMYFAGDHSLGLSRALWVIQPDGSRSLLTHGIALYIHLGRAARNLERAGIPFKVVSFYHEPNGREIENEIRVTRSRLGSAPAILLGTSSIWLGLLTATLTRELRYVVSVGLVGFCVLAIVMTKGRSFKRSGLLNVVSIIPSCLAGYTFAVVAVRFMFR